MNFSGFCCLISPSFITSIVSFKPSMAVGHIFVNFSIKGLCHLKLSLVTQNRTSFGDYNYESLQKEGKWGVK